MNDRDRAKTFAIILPAVAEMFDEQHISISEAMAALRHFLGQDEQPRTVEEAIARLEAIDNEPEFRAKLGEEALRALKPE